MNLAPQSCPRCGSPLQVTADGRASFCPQCRTTFTLQLDVRINNLASLVRSGMEYLRQGDFPNAEEQSRKIIDLDASRGDGWLLKAATTFDIAQADQAFATGLRLIAETERQEFALIFKPLALFVWKKANSMLVRDAGKPGMSRAARQHYEIKAKAAQLSAFAIELFPLPGWQEELSKYEPVKAWDEYAEAERIEMFDMLTRFDSKASSDLDAFIAQRERLINNLAEKLPGEHAASGGQMDEPLTSTFRPVRSAPQPRLSTPRPRARPGCGGWTALVFLIVFLIGIVGSLVTDNKEASTQEQEQPQRHRTPHEFGWALGRQLLRSATTDSGSGGMVVFAQGCRAENPTVKTYTNAEYQQFLNGLMDAYVEWRRNGYTVADTEIKDGTPKAATSASTPRAVTSASTPVPTPTPQPAPSAIVQAPEESPSGDLALVQTPEKSPSGDLATEQTSEESPLGDLAVSRSRGTDGEGEIWLDCTDDSRRTAHLCDHDWRSGQVSFSPDEQWIVVTDGGGPGSSLGTELRVFRREYQNVYTEVPDAGVAEAATRTALRSKHVPDAVELGHVYAEVKGWSAGGRTLKLSVWGHGPGYPEDGGLSPTQVEYSMAALQANKRSRTTDATVNNPPPKTDKAADDVRVATAARDRADVELNEAYKRALVALNPAQQKRLREDERAWLKWRDGEADRLARGSSAQGDAYRVNNLNALTDLIQKRTQTLAAVERTAISTPPPAVPTMNSSTPSTLQNRLPNGAVADPYANYTAVRSASAQPVRPSPPPLAALTRVYTVPELKKLAGTRPSGAGLRGDFVLVSREGSRLLLQSRMELSNFGITSTTNGQADIYRGHTFVTVNCTKDPSRFINGQLVTIPAEQALRIISVSKNSQDRIDVEAVY